tara:strand:+ start:2222 stop:2872 length:651 start_codon:yes stop_codon:yes gene_type:complete
MTAPADTSVIDALAQYHPLIIEGMGGYDPREPAPVAMQIVSQLHDRWRERPLAKPVILVTQGDPLEARGISAITRHLTDELDIPRAMAFLDPDIADYHKPNADHHGVILEIPYSLLTKVVENKHLGVMAALEQAVDRALVEKNQQRDIAGKGALQSYYRDFALLQEVTKAACNVICGALTVAHTSAEISPHSVTSFYRMGVALGLIGAEQIMPYHS